MPFVCDMLTAKGVIDRKRMVFIMFGKQFGFPQQIHYEMIGCNLPIIFTERRHIVPAIFYYNPSMILYNV